MDDVLTFHRYRLIRRIARGGMAEVFLAAHRGAAGFERKVALKKILPVYSGMEEFASLFRDEARISAALDHSGIVQVYDFGQHGGEYYIAMEYVDGPDLEEVVDRCRRRGVLPPVEVVLYIAHRLASCLEYAHSRLDEQDRPLKIIHRDVSPPNVLIGVQGEIKLTDFGVAKAEFRDSMTRPGVLRGKYAYMSPEQVGHRDLDQRSDIFSLGTVLYETLTGVNPFEGSTDYQTIESVGRAEVEPAGFLRPDTPAELDRILITCLEPDPAHRFQDAAQLRRDLATLMLAWPRADDPQCLIDFLHDVFPERATQDTRAALVDGSVPVWEALAHRLSPMLVDLPSAPEVEAPRPIRLIPLPAGGAGVLDEPLPAGTSRLDEAPRPVVASDMPTPPSGTKPASTSGSSAILREVGPKARRRKRGVFEHRDTTVEDELSTDPGTRSSRRAAPRASFLPPVEESLDRISAIDVPVLGEPDSEVFSLDDEDSVVPPPFVSLADGDDPLLAGLQSLPPTTADGIPIVNEWDLEDADWHGPPVVRAEPSPPERRDEAAPELLATEPSLAPVAALAHLAVPENSITDPHGLAPVSTLDRVEEVFEDPSAGFVPESDEVVAADPVGVASGSFDGADAVGSGSGSFDVAEAVLDPPDSSLPDPAPLGDLLGRLAARPPLEEQPTERGVYYKSPDGDAVEGWDVPTATGDEPLADLLARATSGGTRPNAPAWRGDAPERIDAQTPVSSPRTNTVPGHAPRAPAPPRVSSPYATTNPGATSRGGMSSADGPARRRPNPAGAPVDPPPPSFGRVARPRPDQPRTAISFSELPPTDVPVEQRRPGPDELTPPSISFAGTSVPRPPLESLDPPSSPALKVAHGLGTGPAPARLGGRSPLESAPGRRSRPPRDRDVDAPPLRQGRPPRSVQVSQPGMVSVSLAQVSVGTATLSPRVEASQPAAPAPREADRPPPEPRDPTLFERLHTHRRSILYGAVAILTPLLLLFLAGRIGGRPDASSLEPTEEVQPEAPRRIEPLEPIEGRR